MIKTKVSAFLYYSRDSDLYYFLLLDYYYFIWLIDTFVSTVKYYIKILTKGVQ
jgi:hypothetical protein